MAGEMNIAAYAVNLVEALGSTHVFSLTGGMAMYLNRAVAVHPTLTAVYCQHEQACIAAAEGYSKAADFRRAGFAVVTAGPGVSNTVSALISAYGDSTPLIVLAGQIKTADIDSYGTRTHGNQEIHSRELIEPCVKRFLRVDVARFREQLVETITEAFAGRPGPVFIEIPLDVQGVVIPDTQADIQQAVKAIRAAIAATVAADASANTALAGALKALLGAKKPLLYVGNGIRISGMEATIRDFITRHQIPTVFSWLSFDILPGSDPLHFGCPGGLAPIYSNEILGAAEVIVFLGARLDLGTTAFQREAFGHQAARFFVDIDAAELRKFDGFANATTIQADVRGIASVIDALPAPNTAATESWRTWCTTRQKEYNVEETQRLSSENFNVYNVTQVLSAHAANKIFVPASSGYAEETATRFFVPQQGTRFFNGAALGAMGMGLPMAIGAAFGSDRQVICLEADGGIMLNLQELATLANYQPQGFILYLLNNGGYESIRSSQARHFNSVNGADAETGVFIPDFKDVAHAFRLDYRRIETVADLKQFVAQHSSHAKPILVDLIIDKYEYRGPAVKTIMGENGKPTSTPLAEISW